MIYYWPKSKSEAKFQLINIFSLLPIKTEIFIVGENSSGVKSSILILNKWIKLSKIDNARHAVLISGVLTKNTHFILKDFFKIHQWKNLFIQSLPGVFGYKKIDPGSQLLASTFSKKIIGQVLDVGSGTGFLSAALLYYSPKIYLTLIDHNIVALKCSQYTLNINNFRGEVICSHLYSNIFKKFDLIISNPPFHNDLKINFDIIKKFILDSQKYLTKKGELRFVTNINFNFDFLLNQIFKKYYILKQTNKYKVYQAFV